MSSSSNFELLSKDVKADGTKWKRKILLLLMCFLVVILGLLVALIVVSVKLADKEDSIFQNSTFASSSRRLGGFAEWKKIGQCSRECGGGMRKEIRTCLLSHISCFGNNIRHVPCNQHKCQGWYMKSDYTTFNLLYICQQEASKLLYKHMFPIF